MKFYSFTYTQHKNLAGILNEKKKCMLGCYVHTAPDEISTVENSCIKVLIVRKSGRLGRK